MISTLLDRFPKSRPDLPDAYRAIYAEHYRSNREGLSLASSMAQKMESWMHRRVAQDVAAGAIGHKTLEVGAGTLNHLSYEPPSPTYDVVEEKTDLCLHSPHRGRVRNVYRSLDDIQGVRYDRIVSIAAFEHFCNLPAVVAKCGLLLAPGGQLRIAIPSEGTILWKLGWMMTTGVEFRSRYGLDYGVLLRHEHVNAADEIRAILQLFFKQTRSRVLGIHPSLSIYQFFECRGPILDRTR